MKLTLDREADSLLIELKDCNETKKEKVGRGVSVFLDEQGEVVALEVLYLSQRVGRPILEHLDLDLAPPYEESVVEVE